MTENIFNETDVLLHQLFDKAAMSRSDAIALVYEDRRISFFELQLYVEWMSGYFQSINLQPGQRVALFMANSPKLVISLFGLLRADGVAVPLEISSDERELRSTLMLAKTSVIVTTPEYKPLLDNALKESDDDGATPLRLTIAIFEEDNIVTLNKKIHGRRTPVDNGKVVRVENRTPTLPAEGCAHLGVSDAGADHPAAVQIQEAQKFRVYTHDDLRREAATMIAHIQLTANDRMACLAPLYQSNCLSNCLIAAIAAGATMVILEPNNWTSLWQALRDEHITILAGPAALVRRLAESNVAEIPSLRWYFCTDAALPTELGERLYEKAGFRVGQLIEESNTGIPFSL